MAMKDILYVYLNYRIIIILEIILLNVNGIT
jgi:hypothetical protein